MTLIASTAGLLQAGFDLDDIVTIVVLLLYVLPNVISAIRKRLAPEATGTGEAEATGGSPQQPSRTESPPSRPRADLPTSGQFDPLEVLRRRLMELAGETPRPQEATAPRQASPVAVPEASPPVLEQRPPVAVGGPGSRPAGAPVGFVSAADIRTAIVTRAALLPPPAISATAWRRRI